MEGLTSTWAAVAAVIGGVTLVWGFRKTLKEIKDTIEKPLTDFESKVDCKFNALEEKVDESNRSDKLVKSALLSMQRTSILNKCENCFDKGYATMEDKYAISHQFESYKELGGNSFVGEMVDKINDLPLHKPKKKSSKEKVVD